VNRYSDVTYAAIDRIFTTARKLIFSSGHRSPVTPNAEVDVVTSQKHHSQPCGKNTMNADFMNDGATEAPRTNGLPRL